MCRSVTVVMPALNEQNNIAAAIQAVIECFDALKLDGELIVVNDGSSDSTESIISEFIRKDSRIKKITHQTPEGIGASWWDGVRNAQKEFITMLPGDNENEPAETLRYMPLMEHVDMVIPFVFNRTARSKVRTLVSGLYRNAINMLFRTNLNYTNGTVIYRRCVLDLPQKRSTGFFYQTDILVRLIRMGILYAEVPYKLGKRGGGKSKALSVKNLFKVSGACIRLYMDIHFGSSVEKAIPAATATRRRMENEKTN